MTPPQTESDVIAAVQDAHAARETIAITGNASKAAMLRPVHAARAMSLAGLAGVTLHAPKELIVSARAGTTMAELAATVASAGQHIIAEPPDFGALLGSNAPATIGGVVAANLSGPRRVAWGAMRDHVMGVRAVNGLGESIRSGGRILKNVTGLDLCKLLTGSHGTLALLTEITLKVLPAPERRATLVLRHLAPQAAVAALSQALGSPYAVSGAAHLPAGLSARSPALAWLGGDATLIRIEDFAPSVLHRTARLRDELRPFGEAEILDDAASQAVWADLRDVLPLAGVGEAVWRVSVRPSAGPAVAAALEAAFGAEWFMDWGGGLLWIAGPATTAAHDAVCRAAGQGTWTLMRAPDALREAVAVVPPETGALARISAGVKAAFDPDGLFNPGRF
jgi:glycolate oxidase FAD binding subunit